MTAHFSKQKKELENTKTTIWNYQIKGIKGIKWIGEKKNLRNFWETIKQIDT